MARPAPAPLEHASRLFWGALFRRGSACHAPIRPPPHDLTATAYSRGNVEGSHPENFHRSQFEAPNAKVSAMDKSIAASLFERV